MKTSNFFAPVCECCGKAVSKESAKVAYRVPLAEGGSNDLTNIIILCQSCFADSTEYVRAKEKEMEEAEYALAERIDDLAYTFLEELEENNSYSEYLSLGSIKEDFVEQLFYGSCTDRMSFSEFVRESGMLSFYWEESMLFLYATAAGFNEQEAKLFVSLFTRQGVEDKIDDDFVEDLFEYAKRC